MRILLRQIISASWIGLRSIPQRPWLSIATVFTISIVVTTLLAFLAMSEGFRQTLTGGGSPSIAIVMRGGAEAELNSVLSRDQVALVTPAPGIVQKDGEPLVSPELYVVVDGKKRSNQAKVNLPLRGLTAQGIALRDNVTLTAGRMFVPGRNEIVAGESLLREFEGFDIGDTVRFGASVWTVVGTFSTGGSVFESELWSDLAGVQSQFNRGSSVQSVRVRLTDPAAIEDLKAYIANDPRLNVDIKSEKAYFADQAEGTSDLILMLGWPLSIAMALGALAGALNTIYTSVAARTREIATLRAIGYSSLSAFFGTLTESLLLSMVGGFLGALFAYLFFDGISTSTLGSSFTQVVFRLDLTAQLLRDGTVFALLIGLLGGLTPAFRAARLPVALAFSDR